MYVAKTLFLSYLINRFARSTFFTMIDVKNKIMNSLFDVLLRVLLLLDICRLIISFVSLYSSRVILRTYRMPSFLKWCCVS